MLSRITHTALVVLCVASGSWSCSGSTYADVLTDASDTEDTSDPMDTIDSAETSDPLETSDGAVAVDADTGDGFVYTARDGATCPADHDVAAYGCECPAEKVNTGCCTHPKQGFACNQLASGIRWWIPFGDCGCSAHEDCPGIEVQGVCPGYPGP